MWIVILLLLLVAGGGTIAEALTSVTGGSLGPPLGPNSTDPSIFTGGTLSTSTITTDPTTWPYSDGDPIGAVCNAVARAEGYNVPGSNPFKLNNPGDISDGAEQFGSEAHSGSSVTHFPDPETGWQWLYNKWANIVGGVSTVYSPDMSWDQLAQKWAGNWTAWSTNVTNYLGVARSARVGDYFGV